MLVQLLLVDCAHATCRVSRVWHPVRQELVDGRVGECAGLNLGNKKADAAALAHMAQILIVIP